MLIERKQTRQLWLNFLLALIPDAVIAYVAMRVTDSGWVGFAIVFFGLWAVYLAIWLKNSIWGWLVYVLWGKRQMTAAMLSGLRANKYPEPDDFEKSGDDYLQKLVSDESLPVDTRLKAMADFANIHALNQFGFQRFLQVSSALDNALEQYKNQFPPKASVEAQEADDEPEIVGEEDADDEAQVVAKVQMACQIAGMSAGYPDDEYERNRFEEYINKALGIAREIRDEFYHSAAIHQVVSTLIKDNQIDRAQQLAREITVEMIQEKAESELREAGA
jgi:hypothetical protein